MHSKRYFGLAEAARILGDTGRTGGPVHVATLTRWILRGVHTPNGRVKLQAVKIGSRWATTSGWLDSFVTSTTAAHVPVDTAPSIRSPSARHHADEAANAELESLGV